MKKDLSKLTPLQVHVTQGNGTETPFDNAYFDFFEKGIYVDIVSGEVLFSSAHKYESTCGWPSFFKALERDNIVKKIDNSLGVQRVEVRSKNADSHLGHVFTDGPAPTGIRYCINSAAIKFIPFDDLKNSDYEKYISSFNDEGIVYSGKKEFITLGAGCFWGVQAILSKIPGVLSSKSGYAGGNTIDPTYEDICKGDTGHAEVVQISFDPDIINFEKILEYFFRLHDPTTLNYQGHDIGTQYRSVIFYHNEKQKEIAQKYIDELNQKDIYKEDIVTQLAQFQTFYDAEEYHQDYYDKKYKGAQGPICHFLRDF